MRLFWYIKTQKIQTDTIQRVVILYDAKNTQTDKLIIQIFISIVISLDSF